MTPLELTPASRFLFDRWIFPRHYITPRAISCGDRFELCLFEPFIIVRYLLMVSSDYALFGPFVIVRYNSGGSDLHGLDLGPSFDSWTIHLSISPSQKIQMLFSSLSHSIFEKKRKEKKNQIMSFFESLRDSVWEGFADASPWNFVSNKAHQGAFSSFFCFLFCFCFCAFVFFFFIIIIFSRMYSTCILCLLAPQKFLLKNFLPNIIVFSICLLTFWMIPGRKS